MSDISKNSLRICLLQLNCHFTWDIQKNHIDLHDAEERIDTQLEYLALKSKISLFNLMAYVKHLRGKNEEALENLKSALECIKENHEDQVEKKSLVTWGNYAWIYYHMDRLPEAQTYLDKVEASCKRLSSPFRFKLELPEIECEKGWSFLKCGGTYYERAKVCFEKALESDPDHPEFNSGFAIVMYRMDDFRREGGGSKSLSLNPLKKALELNPKSTFIKVLLALKLQDVMESSKGEKYIKEALEQVAFEPYVFRYAAKFYRRSRNLDRAIELLQQALRQLPTSAFLHHQMGLCYRSKVNQIKKAKGNCKAKVRKLMEKTIFHFEKAVKQKSLFVYAFLDLANMYREAGQFEKAEDLFQKVLRIEHVTEEEKQQAHLKYGWFLEFYRGDGELAMYHYIEGIKINPRFCTLLVDALQNLALKRLTQNDLDAKSLGALGFIYKLKGNYKQAIEYYEKALKQDSSNCEYISALIELRLSI